MKRILLIIAAVALASCPAPGQTNRQETPNQIRPPEVGQALAALEQQWADAVKRRDFETIDRIQADDFEFTGPSGEVWTKSAARDFLKAGNLEITSFELSEFKVRQYGETAVVTFRVLWNGSARGIDISGPQRMTDVFVKRDGRWQCVASHATRIVQP